MTNAQSFQVSLTFCNKINGAKYENKVIETVFKSNEKRRYMHILVKWNHTKTLTCIKCNSVNTCLLFLFVFGRFSFLRWFHIARFVWL